MSSTKRKKKNPALDYYPTPHWCTTRFLEKINLRTANSFWLEPCVGNCSILDAVNNFYSTKNQTLPNWTAIEIQESFEEDIKKRLSQEKYLISDFFKVDNSFIKHPNVIITNPPFNHALEFIKKAIELEPEYVCMLLRLNFLGSQERSDYLREHMPDIYVIPNRPSFTGGKTDSIEYAWFVWSKYNDYGKNSSGKIVILETTPANIRKK